MVGDAAGWTWQDTLAVAAVALSVLALIVSWVAYRQRVKYHPQPKLTNMWAQLLNESNGLYLRRGTIWNHGDAPARDLQLEVEHVDNAGLVWNSRNVLEPGEHWSFTIPVVDGVSKHQYGRGWEYERHAPAETYRMVTPRVTVTWRQPPYSAGPKRMRIDPPRTPNVLAGEST